MAVVMKQISIVLQTGSSTLITFDFFRMKLFELSYKKITESEENSQLLEEGVLKSKPVQELCAEDPSRNRSAGARGATKAPHRRCLFPKSQART